jgi:hypothetical protein
MLRSLFVISVNDGLASGSEAQHSSINFLHPVSQCSGTGGLSVLLTIPPSFRNSTMCKIFYLFNFLSSVFSLPCIYLSCVVIIDSLRVIEFLG